MDIRQFTLLDKDQVISLWEECGLTAPWNDPEKDIQRKMKVNPELFFVVKEESKILGTIMCGYDGHRGWVYYLAVCPQNRKKGIGRKLMSHAEQTLKENGCPKINLQVRNTNSAVLEFYKAIGYQVDEAVGLGKRLEADN
ncbi:MAG: GNAT family acetyltransferase [Cellvibrionaceae bacterium]